MIIVDTNVISELMRSRPEERIVDWMDEQPKTELGITTITVVTIMAPRQ